MADALFAYALACGLHYDAADACWGVDKNVSDVSFSQNLLSFTHSLSLVVWLRDAAAAALAWMPAHERQSYSFRHNASRCACLGR